MDIFLSILEEGIKQNIGFALDNIADAVVKKLMENVDKDLYQAYSPQYYQRTRDFFDKIKKSEVKKIGDSYQVKIYFDTSAMSQISNLGGFGTRTSFDDSTSYGGQSISDLLVEWYEDTGTVDIFKSGRANPYPITPIHMVEKTREWLNSQLTALIMMEFKKVGYNIIVS